MTKPLVTSHASTDISLDSKQLPIVPPNAPEGGVWGVMKYNGKESTKRIRAGCIFFLLPGLLMITCPKDSKDAYAVWEKKKSGSDIYLYDSKGELLGKRKRFNWSPAITASMQN